MSTMAGLGNGGPLGIAVGACGVRDQVWRSPGDERVPSDSDGDAWRSVRTPPTWD